MLYQIIPPPGVLQNYVRNFWLLEFDLGDDEKTLKLYSDYYPRLTFQCLDGHSRIQTADGTYLSNSFLSGVITKPVSFTIRGAYAHIAVSFYPHALKQIFKIEGRELVNQRYDLQNFCPASLIAQLHEATDHGQRISVLTNFLVSRIEGKPEDDPLVLDSIFTNRAFNEWDLGAILKKHRISARHLERRFKASIGIPPKTYLRITRLERAFQLLQSNTFDKLSSVAFDLGYSDHSHFTRDFKASTGFTPYAYLASKKAVEYSGSFLEE